MMMFRETTWRRKLADATGAIRTRGGPLLPTVLPATAGLCSLSFAQVATAQMVVPPTASPPPSSVEESLAPPSTETNRDRTGQERASPIGIEDIVVTAQRRAENLQDVPITVATVSSEQAAAFGITDTMSLPQLVPGLTVTKANSWQIPRIRGVGNTAAGPGQENAVATYVDGIYVASSSDSLMSLDNVDRIEVLKGPQGTLFGRNATGGLIHIITSDPKYETSGDFRMGYGNYETVSGNMYITGGITGNLAASLALSGSRRGKGFGRNLVTGRRVGELDHDLSARSKWLWNVAESTSMKLSFDYSSRKGDEIVGQVSGLPYPLYPLAQTPRNPFILNHDVLDTLNVKSGGVSATVSHDFGSITVTSLSSYRKTVSKQSNDFDRGPLPLASNQNRIPENQLSQEFQVASNGRSVDWTAGVYLFRSKYAFDSMDFAFQGPAAANFGVAALHFETFGKTHSAAVYGQASLLVGPSTTLTGGLRYSYEKRYVTSRDTVTIPGVGEIPLPYKDDVSFEKVTWRLSLDHRFSDEFLVYVSANRGFKSGGFDLSSSRNGPYLPEVIDAYEGGIKSNLFDKRLRLNLSTFYYEYSDIQVAAFAGASLVTYNGAKAELYGVDFDTEAVVNDNLSLTGSAAYVHDEFKSFPGAVLTNFTPGAGYYTQTSFNAAGNRLPYTPRLTLTLGASYRFPLGSGELVAHGNVMRSSRWYAEPDNMLSQPRYEVVNGSISWTAPDQRFTLKIFANNLFDKRYVTQLATVAGLAPVQRVAPPRTFGGVVGMKF